MEKTEEQNRALHKEIDRFVQIVRKDQGKLSSGLEQITFILKKHFANAFRSTKATQMASVADTYYSLGQLLDKLIGL
jgi:hypothetical protein